MSSSVKYYIMVGIKPWNAEVHVRGMHAYMEYRTQNKHQLITAPSSSLHNFSKTSVACATGPSVNRILTMEPNSGNTIKK
jgi:hypothetical protein